MTHPEIRNTWRRPQSFIPLAQHAARRIVATLMIALLASPASAQYFGRNKVRYRAFDFKVMTTDHFDIYFYSSEREGAEIAARLAERWYSRLERFFGHTLSERQPLVLYASHADFEQTNVVTGELGEGTGGFTEPLRRRIVLPLAGPIGDSDHVIGHELVHAFQFDMAGALDAQSGDTPFMRLPLWFVEGMAEYVSLGAVDAHAAMKVRDAVRRNELPSIGDLGQPGYFPYQWGHAVFAYIANRYGDQAVPRLLRSGAAFGSAEEAITSVLGISAEELSKDWHTAVRRLYEPALSASTQLPNTGRVTVKGRGPLAGLNFGPSLSPDGRWLAFLSTRSLFAADLYVADAGTGQIVRRLTKMTTDPHYTSIQFVNSSGTWDPSSTRIAIGTVAGGRAAIAIFNASTGKRDRDIVMTGIDEVRHPTWAPDGHAIAFTGMRQGVTDLYVYDFAAGTVTPLTTDAYADLHPAWAPDSRRIAFATDRFSTQLDSLQIGALRLAVADTASGTVEPLVAFDTGKHINPQWSIDGRMLYFVADPDGVPNVYRLTVGRGDIRRMTAVGSGVSGITTGSPALSVSPATDRLAVSLYENEGYQIYVWTAGDVDPVPATVTGNAAALSPIDRGALARPAMFAGLDASAPSAQAYPTTPYQPKMSLIGGGPPTAGLGVGSFGVAAAGGAGFAFSDMLGDRLLVTGVQVGQPVAGSTSLNDIAYDAGYLRQDRRWNWGFVTRQVPYVTGAFETVPDNGPDGDPLMIDRLTIVREMQRNGSGILSYPFDRSRRLELAGGFTQSWRERIVTSTVYSPSDGNVVSGDTDVVQLGQRLNLGTSAAVLVADTAVFGPASPVVGERYRLDVAPTLGSINFTSVLIDYRRYVMPVAFYTIAARVIHYGRYGSGAEDARLHWIYVNDPGLVRGYDTLESSVDCVTSRDQCGPHARFIGSRVLVGNLELRFPLLRPFGGMYGPLPIEVALFGDGGVPWRRGENPSFLGGSRPGISSVGVAFRLPLGFTIAEFDAVRPFQRSDRGWTFGFNMIPGW